MKIDGAKLPVIIHQRSYKRWLAYLLYIPVAAVLYSETTKTYFVHFTNISDAMLECKDQEEFTLAINVACEQFVQELLADQDKPLKDEILYAVGFEAEEGGDGFAMTDGPVPELNDVLMICPDRQERTYIFECKAEERNKLYRWSGGEKGWIKVKRVGFKKIKN